MGQEFKDGKPVEEIGKPENKPSFKERLTSLFSFGKKDDAEPEVVGEPGSAENPWIGPYDKKLGRPRYGYSGKELRRIRRAQGRRENAQQRLGQREYNKVVKVKGRHEADNRQRDRIKSGEIKVPAAVLENIRRDEARIADLPAAQAWLDQRAEKAKAREDRLAERREARFRAGTPRGKDLREETYNEHESLLPSSVNRRG